MTAALQVRIGARGRMGAFTLIELLVVLALLAILSGLILPSLARGRSASHSARCISNLHQMGIAAQMYWDDHAGRAFSERTVRTNGGWRYWFGWLQDGSEGERTFDPAAGALWPYLPAAGIETCPALDRCSTRFKDKARGAAFGYAYNLLVGPRGRPAILPNLTARPSELALFADGGQVNDFLFPASADRPMLEEFYYFDTNTLSATIHFRHTGRAATTFGDGHVQMRLPDAGSLDMRLPGEVIGRLPADSVVP